MHESSFKSRRERLKAEFLERGISETTSPQQVLELVLCFCTSDTDTSVMAQKMLEKYKTFSGILDASVKDLLKFDGITLSNVVLLKSIIPISRMCSIEDAETVLEFKKYSDLCNYIVAKYEGFTVEKFGIACMSSTYKLKRFEIIAQGDSTSVDFSNRSILQPIIESNSCFAVIVHNHPGGVSAPSAEDINKTYKLRYLFSRVGVCLYDHLIIVNNRYISLRESEMYSFLFL